MMPLLRTVLVLAALSFASAPALAGQEIRYLTGWKAAQAAAAEEVEDYNLRLAFAAGTPPHYVSGVSVSVEDPWGRVVLELPAAGPLVLIDLPHGRYFVRVARRGMGQTRGVVVGEHSGARALFTWPA